MLKGVSFDVFKNPPQLGHLSCPKGNSFLHLGQISCNSVWVPHFLHLLKKCTYPQFGHFFLRGF